ncbi:alpha/beta-hydrolase [Obba rivulosa]|uniref:Alpha/beta-hydrolase n=1 Tax=Obba rivulosa TaxID=1052685 RepID=A0A8E2DMR2_9APHY|nr:alpha/beta-hydrolase [Obba rivulosa]
MTYGILFLTGFLLFSLALAFTGPSVILDEGILIGKFNGSAEAYLGIPYAKQPVGTLRYRQAERSDPFSGVLNVTEFGPICPQESEGTPTGSEGADLLVLDSLLSAKFPDPGDVIAEDCLRLNIWVPKGSRSGDDLPVVVVSYSCAFVFGASSSYSGEAIVQRSIQNGQPIIYVNLNYRPDIRAAFGFLPGREAQEAGITNLGLRDQRQALRWLQQYISAFGGDPHRVTIWGLNAGSESVALQMLTNGGNTEGLFSGAVMQSGFPLPLNNFTQLQSTYDAYVSAANCTGTPDTLECLRQAPFETLISAMNTIPPETITEGWEVIVDDDFIPEQPTTLLMKGSVARVPYIIADTDDEGTETALFLTTLDTDAAVTDFIATQALPGVSDTDAEQILALYPDDPTQGSPFNTSTDNQLFPHFKQLSAIVGDLEFQGLRRFFLNQTSSHQPSWTYLSKLFKDLPGIGAATSTDLLNLYGPGVLTDYLINFVARGDPNNGTGLFWPQWKTTAPNILTIANESVPLSIMDDTFREEGMNLLISLLLQNPQ